MEIEYIKMFYVISTIGPSYSILAYSMTVNPAIDKYKFHNVPDHYPVQHEVAGSCDKCGPRDCVDQVRTCLALEPEKKVEV